MKTYVTFRRHDIHRINGKTFNKNCVAVIECDEEKHGKELAFKYFGGKYCFDYFEDLFDLGDLDKFYPRGLIPVNFTVDESTKESATPQEPE